jgi:hypothetical protein
MALNPELVEMSGKELFPKVEFDHVFPRAKLQTVFEPLRVKTGVELFKLYQAHVQSPGREKPWSESAAENSPHLSAYFNSEVRKRAFLPCPEVMHPEKRTPLDYLVMEEKIREGVDALVVFAVPPPDDPFWKRVNVGKDKAKFTYLKAVSAYLILSDLGDPQNVDKKQAIEITAPLFTEKKPEIEAKTLGFLANTQDNPVAEQADLLMDPKNFLIRDRPPVNLDLLSEEFLVGDFLTEKMREQFEAAMPELQVVTPQGETREKLLGSVWGQIMHAAALQYLLLNNHIHRDSIRASLDMKKFGECFYAACGTFFLSGG